MPAVQAVFFDLFNTLISVGRVPVSVGRLTADILGFDHEQWNMVCFSNEHEICAPTRHEDVLRKLAHSLDPAVPEHLIQQATQERQARFDYALCHIEGDVLSALSSLKKKSLQLCLISNASTAEVSAWRHSPLADIFDHAIFSCECGMRKPDVTIFQHALQCLQVNANDSLFVGDGGSNEFIGARASGLDTVLTRQFSRQSHQDMVKRQQGAAIKYEIEHVRDLVSLCE